MIKIDLISKLIAILFCVVFFGGCSSTTKKSNLSDIKIENSAQGRWSAKAMINDLKKQNKNYLDLDIIARKPNDLRVELSGTFGVSVATIVTRKNEISYALPRQKKFYYGLPSEHSLRPIFGFNLSPKIFVSIVFDEPLSDLRWQCTRNHMNKIEKCLNKELQINVVWQNLETGQKKILINNPDFEIQVVFKDFDPKVNIDEQTFVLKPPNDFSTYKLN
jgi:hypothetical protein